MLRLLSLVIIVVADVEDELFSAEHGCVVLYCFQLRKVEVSVCQMDVTWTNERMEWTFCEAAFEKAMCSGSGVSGCAAGLDAPYRASLRKPALARIEGYLYTALDPCQMLLELDWIVMFMFL